MLAIKSGYLLQELKLPNFLCSKFIMMCFFLSCYYVAFDIVNKHIFISGKYILVFIVLFLENQSVLVRRGASHNDGRECGAQAGRKHQNPQLSLRRWPTH
jgi:hypothetical protein